MPDASGRFLGISVPAAAWERIFGGPTYACPDRPECQSCPAASEDDVCLPHDWRSAIGRPVSRPCGPCSRGDVRVFASGIKIHVCEYAQDEWMLSGYCFCCGPLGA